MASRYAYLDHRTFAAFAHRGGNTEWPENTMEAFQDAIDLGYDYIETDVHASSDGVLYTFHDATLMARTGMHGTIGERTADEVDQILVDGRAAIPRLDEVLSSWPELRLNIETKTDDSVLPLIDAVRAHQAIDRVCIGSFVDRRIKRCRRDLGPDLCTSMGRIEATRLYFAARGLADAAGLEAACAQLPYRWRLSVTTPRLVEFAHEHGIDVHVWTVNDPADMRALLDMDVDGLMSDDPRTLRRELIQRGRWPRPEHPETASAKELS